MEHTQNHAFSRMSLDLTRNQRKEEKSTIADIEPEGLYRWAQIKDLLPISESTWRRRIAAGKAPKPIVLSSRCTLWRGSDILQWILHPDKYSAK